MEDRKELAVPGKVLDKLLATARLVGEGSSATVFVGTWRRKRTLCVKVYKDDFLEEEMEQEIVTLLRVKNVPGIVQLIGICSDRRALVMSHAGSFTLGDMVRLFPDGLSQLEILQAVADVADTLGRLHEIGLSHNDIKSDNIVVNITCGCVETTVADMGSVTKFGKCPYGDSKEEGETYDHIAPELNRGLPATPLSDVYSLGFLLQEVVEEVWPKDQRPKELIWIINRSVRRRAKGRLTVEEVGVHLKDLIGVLTKNTPKA